MDSFFTAFVVFFIIIFIFAVIKTFLKSKDDLKDKKSKINDIDDTLFIQNSSDLPINFDDFSNNFLQDIQTTDFSSHTNIDSGSSDQSSSNF